MIFSITKHTNLSQDKIFQISTDIDNFHKVLPDYFKSLELLETNNDEQIFLEKIVFLGIPLKIKTKHIVRTPDIHKIYILTGLTKGTEFIERYDSLKDGTKITIDVRLQLFSGLRFFRFIEKYLSSKMISITEDFITAAERFAANSTPKSC